MEIPKMPQTKEELMAKINLLSEKIKSLEKEKKELNKNYPALEQNRKSAYSKYRSSESEEDLKLAFLSMESERLAINRIADIQEELSTINLCKRYLEKMAEDYSLKSKKDEDEPVGGTLGG